MPWVTRTEQREKDDGRPYMVTVRVWVNPAPVVDERAQLLKEQADRRKAAAKPKLTAAQVHAAALAAKKERDRLKHQAWMDLQARANALRANMRGPDKPKVAPAVSGGAAGSMSSAEMKARAAAAKTVGDKVAIARGIEKAKGMSAEEEMRLGKLYRRDKAGFDRQMKDRADKVTVAVAKSKPGDVATARELERILNERRKRQADSGGKDLDTAFVRDVADALTAHALKVRDDLIRAATKLNEHFTYDKKGNVVSFKGTKKQYDKMLKSFNAVKAEHDRLFLDVQTDPKKTKGSLYAALDAADQMALSQRQYIRDAAKEVFFKDTSLTGRDEAMRDKAWEAAKWDYVVEMSERDIDPDQTSIIYEADKKTGKVTGRHRTVKEEFEFQQGLYKAEMERRMKDFADRQALQQSALALASRYAGASGRDTAAQGRVALALASAQTQLGHGGDDDWLKQRGNVEKTVDQAMRQWESDNKRLFQSANAGPRSIDKMNPIQLQKYRKAYEEARAEFYRALGTNPRSIIDSIADSPINVITTPLAATLGGASGLITGTARLALQNFTGQSQYYAPINHGDMPPGVVADINKRAAAQAKADIANRKIGDGGVFITENGQYIKYQNQYTKEWLAGEGKQWATDFEAQRHATADEQTAKFIRTFYGGREDLKGFKDPETGKPVGGHDLWERLGALGEYGSTPTTSAALNLALGIALDPTIAMPMKFTTWAARWAHAAEATRGLNLAQRVTKGLVEFQKVDEPTLRWQKFVRPYMKDIAAGADPRILEEGVLQRLAGIKDGAQRNKAAEEFLQSIGVDTRSTSGKLMLNSTQEAIVSKLKEMGVNYEDVAQKAVNWETERRTAAQLLKDEETRVAREADLAEEAEKARVLAEATQARLKLAGERQVAIDKQAEKVRTLEEAPPPLKKEAPPAAGTAESGVEHPEILKMKAADPLRDDTPIGQALRQEQEPLAGVRSKQYAAGEVLVSDAAGTAATILHVITGGSSDVTYKGGVRFAPGSYLDAFMASPEKAEIARILNAPVERAGVKRTTEEILARPAVTAKQQAEARLRLREAGEQSIAERNRGLEGLNTEARPLDAEGNIPYATGDTSGKYYTVVGGLPSSEQYIPTTADLAARAGIQTPMGEVQFAQLSAAFEGVKKRLVSAHKRREGLKAAEEEEREAVKAWRLARSSGDVKEVSLASLRRTRARIALEKSKRLGLDATEYEKEIEEIRRIGVFRRSAGETVDIASGDGKLVMVPSSELEHILGGGMHQFIPVGNALVEDFLPTGALNHYYETLSLLPELMTGPGYETKLMENFLDRSFREQLGAERFAAIVRTEMFQVDVVNPPSPQQFRQGMAHLFALFHLSRLDAEDALYDIAELQKRLHRGELTEEQFRSQLAHIRRQSNNSIERLHEYSLVMRVQLASDPSNIYARAWAVMEARGGGPGLWWAENTITESEALFVKAALDYGHNIHPNLALQMIPYGPIARSVPVGHGYTFHMRNLATTSNRLFPGSPGIWTDNVVVDQFGKIANPRTTREQGIQTASQIAHYVATRYGSSLRRKRFRTVLNDFSIDELRNFRGTSAAADYEYQNLRSAYVRQQMLTLERAVDPNLIAKEFDDMFEVVVKGEIPMGSPVRRGSTMFRGQWIPTPRFQRRMYTNVHRIWEEAYWRNEVTHANAGLHTAKFFERMGEPRMQRGDSWLRYANSYYDHMVVAGAEEEARTVLKTMFEQRIAQEARSAFETLRDLPESAPMNQNIWRGGVREFFVRSGVLPDMERILAEGEKRVQFERQFAQLEQDAAAMRNELLIEDDALREQQRLFAAKDESSAMYDMASIEHLADASVKWSDEAFAAARDVRMLSEGKTAFEQAVQNVTRLDAEADRLAAIAKKTLDSADIAAADKALVAADRSAEQARKFARRMKREEKAATAVEQARTTLDSLPATASAEARAVAEKKLADAEQALDKMGVGTHRLSPSRKVTTGIKRPSQGRMKSYNQRYRRIVRDAGQSHKTGYEEFAKTLSPEVRKLFLAGKGKQAANLMLGELPPDAMAWMRAEVRQVDAERQMTKLLNSVIYRTKDMGQIPVHVGDQMEALVKVIKEMPGGVALLKQYGETYYDDLLRTRLIDYFKNEDWFKWQGREVGAESVVIDLTKRMAAATKEAGDARESLRNLTRRNKETDAAFAARRTRLQDKISGLEADRAGLEREREELIAGRPEGGLTPAEVVPPQVGAARRAAPEPPAPPTGMRGQPSVYNVGEMPTAPHPDDLNSAAVAAAQEGLRILEQQTESEWLSGEVLRAQQALHTATGPLKAKWLGRLDELRKAQKVIAYAESGGKKGMVKPRSRVTFAASVVSSLGERARKSIAPKIVTSYAPNAAAAEVEQGRMLRVLLQNSQVADPNVMKSAVRRPGEATATFRRHGTAIEARFGTPIQSDILTRRGFPPDLLSTLNATELVTNLDEFTRAMKDPRFSDFVVEFTNRMDAQIREITSDPNYGLEAWLDDRLAMKMDHFPIRDFEPLEQEVADAIAAERQFHRRTRTDLIRPRGDGPVNVMSEAVETDIRAVVAKAKVLSKYGIDPHAYNEAHKVLRIPLLRKRAAQTIIAGAEQAAKDTLAALGKKVGDRDWDDLYRVEYDKEFDIRRAAMADTEADSLLNQLAYEMHDATRIEVITEFERRYGMDFEIRDHEPQMLTPFQHRTVQEATKTLLGVQDLDNISEMTAALAKHGTAPPFHSRDAMVEHLTKYGFWSRRTGDQIAAAGSKSWDIRTEAKYYADHWGTPPPWADASLFDRGGELHHLLHDEVERGAQWRAWGVFGRNMRARFESGEMTRAERARFLAEGSEALGVKAKRDLPMERQYVIDRYGDMVTDEAGNLTAFPELMNRDELRTYIITRTRDDLGVADGIFQTVEEQEVYYALLDAHVGRMADRMIAGDTVTFDDVFQMSAEIVHDMMLNPVWSRRTVDAVGDLIRGQAMLRRTFIFTNPAFAGTNIVDSVIKAGWARFSQRSFHKAGTSARAKTLRNLTDWGFEPHGQLLRDIPVAGWERIRAAKARNERLYYNFETGEVIEETAAQKVMANGLQTVLAVTEFPAQAASASENFFKVRLAQGMYDEAYARALRDLGGDEGLADAAARAFIKDEVNRFWPTVGDGPIEQLFNQFFPFMSYQFKNRTLWLGELASHPYLFNYFNKIGDFIEAENRARWKREGTENQHTDVEARQIELPWAPGLMLDVGAWSDIQAGLKPFYDLAKGTATPKSLASQFVRLVSANELNLFYGTLNALDMGLRTEWIQGIDEHGYPNGQWSRVTVPWEAPWGGEANALNSFWLIETAQKWLPLLDGQFTVQEATQAVYQLAFFGGLKANNPAAGLQSFYFTLRDKNPTAAAEWLLTADGLKLKMYWADKGASQRTQDWNPQAVNDLLFPRPADRSPWLHAQDPALQEKIKQGFADMRLIHKKWDNILWSLTPGTPEYSEAKLRARMEIFEYYRQHDYMYDYEAGAMTPEKWAKELDQWRTDDRVDEFFSMTAPDHADYEVGKKYKTAAIAEAAYQSARKEWLQRKVDFLKAFPTVAERLASTRTSIEAVWRDTEQHWFDVLDRIGTRSVAIEAAKASKNYPLLDQLYAANDLDYAQLSEETAVNYFDPTTDFVPLGYDKNGKELQGPRVLRQDPFGNALLQRTKLLPDFNEWRYKRADAAGKAKIERDFKYANGMRDVIAEAKKAKNFGAKFVELVKADPWLMREYFARNKGKKEEWATNDAYISLIGRFGKLMRAGKFDEGHQYFDSLPDWVKSRYYNNHPEKRAQRARGVENLQYLNYMKRWTNYYKSRDYAGGAAFFDKLPKWVKDRYYSKHPDGFGKGGTGGTSPYAKAMKKWVDLLQGGEKDAAKDYFDALPKAYKDRYYQNHPEAKLRDDIKRVGQLGQYFAADDANRAQYLKDNPEFAKWLKSQGTSEQTRRMEILAAYRGLPKDEAWLRRVFREKYPEIFSKEAAGESALKKVYTDLVDHPELNAGFEKWLAAVWSSYAENLKHTASRPKPVVADHSVMRQHGSDRATPHSGKSAAWVRLHSLS